MELREFVDVSKKAALLLGDDAEESFDIRTIDELLTKAEQDAGGALTVEGKSDIMHSRNGAVGVSRATAAAIVAGGSNVLHLVASPQATAAAATSALTRGILGGLGKIEDPLVSIVEISWKNKIERVVFALPISANYLPEKTKKAFLEEVIS